MGGKVYIGSYDDHIYCFDANTGQLIWKYGTGSVYASPAVFDDRVYVGSLDLYLYCFNADTGDLIWRYKTDERIFSSPAVADDKVYFRSRDFYIYCLDADTGELIWRYKTGSYVQSSPAVAYGKLYVGSRDGNIYCFGEKKPPYTSFLSESKKKLIPEVQLEEFVSWLEHLPLIRLIIIIAAILAIPTSIITIGRRSK